MKVAEWALPELRAWWSSRRRAQALLDERMDPLLKAADEFVGKLGHLARGDFKEVIGVDLSHATDLETLLTLTNNCYLFAQFWAQMQILRVEGIYASLASRSEGKRLLGFISALESLSIRDIGRAQQRGLGECLLDETGSRPIGFFQFYERFCRDERLRSWFSPLIEALSATQHTSTRQELLVYGAVVHAMIDSLDHKHKVTREKPGWANKLTKRSRKDLRYRIFSTYLLGVERPEKYYGQLDGKAPGV